jgi:hypothetical protein
MCEKTYTDNLWYALDSSMVPAWHGWHCCLCPLYFLLTTPPVHHLINNIAYISCISYSSSTVNIYITEISFFFLNATSYERQSNPSLLTEVMQSVSKLNRRSDASPACSLLAQIVLLYSWYYTVQGNGSDYCALSWNDLRKNKLFSIYN